MSIKRVVLFLVILVFLFNLFSIANAFVGYRIEEKIALPQNCKVYTMTYSIGLTCKGIKLGFYAGPSTSKSGEVKICHTTYEWRGVGNQEELPENGHWRITRVDDLPKSIIQLGASETIDTSAGISVGVLDFTGGDTFSVSETTDLIWYDFYEDEPVERVWVENGCCRTPEGECVDRSPEECDVLGGDYYYNDCSDICDDGVCLLDREYCPHECRQFDSSYTNLEDFRNAGILEENDVLNVVGINVDRYAYFFGLCSNQKVCNEIPPFEEQFGDNACNGKFFGGSCGYNDNGVCSFYPNDPTYHLNDVKYSVSPYGECYCVCPTKYIDDGSGNIRVDPQNYWKPISTFESVNGEYKYFNEYSCNPFSTMCVPQPPFPVVCDLPRRTWSLDYYCSRYFDAIYSTVFVESTLCNLEYSDDFVDYVKNPPCQDIVLIDTVVQGTSAEPVEPNTAVGAEIWSAHGPLWFNHFIWWEDTYIYTPSHQVQMSDEDYNTDYGNCIDSEDNRSLCKYVQWGCYRDDILDDKNILNYTYSCEEAYRSGIVVGGWEGNLCGLDDNFYCFASPSSGGSTAVASLSLMKKELLDEGSQTQSTSRIFLKSPLHGDDSKVVRVSAKWLSNNQAATNTPFFINHVYGQDVLRINQRDQDTANLGTYVINESSNIMVTNDADGIVIFDKLILEELDCAKNPRINVSILENLGDTIKFLVRVYNNNFNECGVETYEFSSSLGGIFNDTSLNIAPNSSGQTILTISNLENGDYNLSVSTLNSYGLNTVKRFRFNVNYREEAFAFSRGWSLISLPYEPVDKRPEVVFRGVDINGALYRYDPNTGSYKFYDPIIGDFGNLDDLSGYWLHTDEIGSINYLTIETNEEKIILLPKKSWYIIAGPSTDMDIENCNVKDSTTGNIYSFREAANRRWITPKMYYLKNGSYKNVGLDPWDEEILRPWYGYWFHTERDNLELIY